MTKFVIDSNIVFSAILNPNNKIGQIILNGHKYFNFFSIDQLKNEIIQHEEKILKISGLEYNDYLRLNQLILSKIKFIHHLLIDESNFKRAENLTKDIDPDDLLFVGLSIQYKCKLWTGDHKLSQGLTKKGFKQVISTEEIFRKYLEQEFKRQH